MLKELEKKLLVELIKNSRRSDRELAKAIGSSQPTTTRLRCKLEQEGYIREYTIIPNFSKIGYSIMALNFLKFDSKLNQEQVELFRKTHPETIGRDPFGVILIQRGMGLGYDAAIISLHQNYSSYDAFRNYVKAAMGASITEMNTFLINLEEEKSTLPLTFTFLAIQLLKSSNQLQNRNDHLIHKNSFN
ncbi:MAG: winged helix-turn-helix transcriptional regulator [Candidatus Bathyarchaeota archaeon]|nr:winged helix-turn-helix transcriptional regulator [Candidatus Bathyarchaeota archaeon]